MSAKLLTECFARNLYKVHKMLTCLSPIKNSVSGNRRVRVTF